MGMLYRSGLAGAKDEAGAVKWFTRAAELGQSKAMFYLAEDYLTGTGVKADKGKAYTWMLLAASAGNPEAKSRVNQLQQELDESARKKSEKKAEEWTQQHRILLPVLGR
jgi:TPR repeat protein